MPLGLDHCLSPGVIFKLLSIKDRITKGIEKKNQLIREILFFGGGGTVTWYAEVPGLGVEPVSQQ